MADREGEDGRARRLGGRAGYDPVADLAERYPDWTLSLTTLGWGIREVLSPGRQVVLVERRGSPAQVRSSVAHAVAHLDLGHAPLPAGFFERRQERQADLLAAGRLVPFAALQRVCACGHDWETAAAELGVDRSMLTARLLSCTGSERALLEATVARAHDVA